MKNKKDTMNKVELKMFQALARHSAYSPESKMFSIRIDNRGVVDKILYNHDLGDLFIEAVCVYSDKNYLQFCADYGVTNEFVMECSELLRNSVFEAPHMIPINHKQHNIPERDMSIFDVPKMLPEIPLLMALTDKMVSKITSRAELAFPRCYGTRWGMPLAVVTGLHSGGLERNLTKMASNKGDVDSTISDSLIMAGIIMLAMDVGIPHKKEQKLEYEIPTVEIMSDVLKKYHTSPGVVPIGNPCYAEFWSDGESKIKYKMPTTKVALADAIAKIVYDALHQIEEVSYSGVAFDRVGGAAISMSAVKYEILNASSELGYEDMVSIHNKIRLFFIEGMHHVLLSHTALLSIFNTLSCTGFEIGTRLSRGGFLEVWRNHSCGTEGDNDEDWEIIYGLYPFLREREYGEADVSSFDQSLLYRLLMAVAVFFCMYYNMDSPLTRTVMGDISFRLVFKYLYLVPLNKLFLVMGMMFSGKYETSHGNTVYQNIVFFMYISQKLQKFKNDEHYSILKMCIDKKMFSRSYSGDDLFFGWPSWLRVRYNICIDDFKDFAAKCGLIFKYCKTGPLYSIVTSECINGYWVTTLRTKGITFLKNMMARNFERIGDTGPYVFVGTYPYRPASDLFFRIGNSDKANSKIDSYFAKLLSIMYLSFGNREVFNYVSLLYYKSKRLYGWDGVCDLSQMEHIFRGSNFFYQAKAMLLERGFVLPTLQELRELHDRGDLKVKKLLVSFSYYFSTKMSKDDLAGWDFF